MIRVGFLYTRLRVEEKYLLEELENENRGECNPHPRRRGILRHHTKTGGCGCALRAIHLLFARTLHLADL